MARQNEGNFGFGGESSVGKVENKDLRRADNCVRFLLTVKMPKQRARMGPAPGIDGEGAGAVEMTGGGDVGDGLMDGGAMLILLSSCASHRAAVARKGVEGLTACQGAGSEREGCR